MDEPILMFSYFIQQIVDKHPNLAFFHVVEPRVSGVDDRVPTADQVCHSHSHTTPSHIPHIIPSHVTPITKR